MLCGCDLRTSWCVCEEGRDCEAYSVGHNPAQVLGHVRILGMYIHMYVCF